MDNQNHNDLSDIITELNDLKNNWYGSLESKRRILIARNALLDIITWEEEYKKNESDSK